MPTKAPSESGRPDTPQGHRALAMRQGPTENTTFCQTSFMERIIAMPVSLVMVGLGYLVLLYLIEDCRPRLKALERRVFSHRLRIPPITVEHPITGETTMFGSPPPPPLEEYVEELDERIKRLEAILYPSDGEDDLEEDTWDDAEGG